MPTANMSMEEKMKDRMSGGEGNNNSNTEIYHQHQQMRSWLLLVTILTAICILAVIFLAVFTMSKHDENVRWHQDDRGRLNTLEDGHQETTQKMDQMQNDMKDTQDQQTQMMRDENNSGNSGDGDDMMRDEGQMMMDAGEMMRDEGQMMMDEGDQNSRNN